MSLTDEQKDYVLQLIGNVEDRLTQVAFKLEDNEDIPESEWDYYNDQFIKMSIRLKDLKDAIYGY